MMGGGGVAGVVVWCGVALLPSHDGGGGRGTVGDTEPLTVHISRFQGTLPPSTHTTTSQVMFCQSSRGKESEGHKRRDVCIGRELFPCLVPVLPLGMNDTHFSGSPLEYSIK